MPYVIAAPCLADFSCVTACPVDCIKPASDVDHIEQLYINPALCINCGACADVCPVEAIFDSGSLPEQWRHYAKINHDYFLESVRSQ